MLDLLWGQGALPATNPCPGVPACHNHPPRGPHARSSPWLLGSPALLTALAQQRALELGTGCCLPGELVWLHPGMLFPGRNDWQEHLYHCHDPFNIVMTH